MAEGENATESAPQSKPGLPLKMIVVVGGLMLVEAVAVMGIMVFTAGGSTSAGELAIEGAEAADREQPVEVELTKGRFLNLSTGRAWQWQAEIYVRVRKKNVDKISSEIERRRVEIDEGVSEIFARAQERHLREPGRETLKRQMLAFAVEVFGADSNGVPRVDEVMIVNYRGSPIDY
ncbi:MAG: hypothetical protein AAFR38_03185 [Planctomycetota bacterium]